MCFANINARILGRDEKPTAPIHTMTGGVRKRAKKQMRDAEALTTAAPQPDTSQAIPGLLNDIVINHVLRFEHFRDPGDLAVLRAVSRAMRDAVDATGLRLSEMPFERAAELGCSRAVRRMILAGRSSSKVHLCHAAAAGGQLEEFKFLRAAGCPWDEETCAHAALGGHLDVLKWARAIGCPWDGGTCAHAALRGHLEVLKWARANGCPWDGFTRRLAASKGYVETRTPCVPWVFGWAR